METMTKAKMRRIVGNKALKLFEAKDWETFKRRLKNVTDQLLSLEYHERSAEVQKKSIEKQRDSLYTYLEFKYVHNQKLALKRLTKDTRYFFMMYVDCSLLPGKMRAIR